MWPEITKSCFKPFKTLKLQLSDGRKKIGFSCPFSTYLLKKDAYHREVPVFGKEEIYMFFLKKKKTAQSANMSQ